MGLPAEKRRYTVAEYFALEEAALEKHEYRQGEILAMYGGTLDHSGINSNVLREVGNRLKGKPCRAYDSNLRVRVGPGDRYVYPDALVICGEPQFDPDDEKRTTVRNPRVVIEVLSDSTEANDRGDKFASYRTVQTVQEYVLVSQHRPMIEVFSRLPDGLWRLSVAVGTDAVARLESLSIDLPLSEVYDGVTFPPEPDPGSGGIIVPAG